MKPQTKNELRFVLACVLTLFAILMAYVTLTAPMIATTGPAILTVAAGAAAFFTWRS